MLSYHTEPRRIRTCSYWLGLAIHFARDAQAFSYHDHRHSAPQRRTLKRLWWSCILRDRIVSLGLRRPLLINSDDFDFTLPPLTAADLNVTVPGSNVYNSSTRKDLAMITECTCKLAIVLTDVLMLVVPRKEPSLPTSEGEARRSLVQAQKCRMFLHDWYRDSSPTFAKLERNDDARQLSHLYINMSYLYYQ